MFYLLIFFIIIMTLSMIIMKLTILISKKMKLSYEKMSPFECGFEPISQSRMPFSIHFFLITVIFLIFDVEIAIILPSIKTLNFSLLKNWIFTNYFMFFILLFGLIHEWKQGALNWM